ncbi:type I restriction enzyme HsdR N-terminal domain-containing protein [Flavobacteriaceae bacterium F08102]|nr:type I restriction enzyme HsdR N-terminal domain-containing protein [Flavobacteriaceae bacterium F08102]
MRDLNLPSVKFKVKNTENKQFIFDIIRKKYIVLTPEEWVRQHVIHFLHEYKGYSRSLIAVEKQLKLYSLTKRFDILVFDRSGHPFIAVECKAPSVPIRQDTFDQIARYNMTLKAKYLMVTNGLKHYFCSLNEQGYSFLEDIPKAK